MEVNSQLKQKVKNLIQSKLKHNLERELEAVFVNVSEKEFVDLLSYLKNKYKHNLHVQKDTLDISLTGLNDRYTIKGRENIEHYCKFNNFDNIDLDDIEFVQKGIAEQVNDENYGYKFNLKPERKNMKNNFNKTIDNHKTFRLKKRVSIIDGSFQIDATIVKQSKRPSQNIIASDVFNEKDQYEFEIELRDTKDMKWTTIYEDYMKIISEFLQVRYNTIGYLVSKQWQRNILTNYLEILRKYKRKEFEYNSYTQLLANPKRYFVSPQATTIHQRHLDCQLTNFDTICQDYTVTDKADGQRSILFIDNKKDLYLIDNRLSVTPLGLKHSTHYDTIVDCEVVSIKNKHLILCFDVYFIDGNHEVSTFPLIASSQSRYSALQVRPILSMIKSGE